MCKDRPTPFSLPLLRIILSCLGIPIVQSCLVLPTVSRVIHVYDKPGYTTFCLKVLQLRCTPLSMVSNTLHDKVPTCLSKLFFYQTHSWNYLSWPTTFISCCGQFLGLLPLLISSGWKTLPFHLTGLIQSHFTAFSLGILSSSSQCSHSALGTGCYLNRLYPS